MPAVCSEIKHNRRVPNFHCTHSEKHSGVHIDPASGTRWAHPSTPYGMRAPQKNSTGVRYRTKHGCYFSAAPAKH